MLTAICVCQDRIVYGGPECCSTIFVSDRRTWSAAIKCGLCHASGRPVLPGSSTCVIEVRAYIVGETILRASCKGVSKVCHYRQKEGRTTHYALPMAIPVHPAPHLRGLSYSHSNDMGRIGSHTVRYNCNCQVEEMSAQPLMYTILQFLLTFHQSLHLCQSYYQRDRSTYKIDFLR